MIRNAFNNFKRESLTQLGQNKINGFDGEHLGASLLTLALMSRINWGSRTEDDSKVDLNVIFNCPWNKNQVQNIFTQIKSGETYGSLENINSKDFLKIKKGRFKEFIQRDHHSLICWVDRNNHELYWFIIKRNAKYFRDLYGASHKLTPASRFDVTRIINSIDNTDGGKGLNFSVVKGGRRYDKYKDDEFLKLRIRARNFYNRLKKSPIKNPIFGEIEVSKYGWEHITRASRYSPYIVASFEIMPILEPILKCPPSKHFIQNFWEENDDSNVYRKIEYLLEYSNVSQNISENNSKVTTIVFVKLMEFISYPKNWKTNAVLSQSIKRRVVFRSVYYK